MNVGGALMVWAIISGLVFVVFNYRGRYGKSDIGLVPATVVGAVLTGIIILWSAIT